MIPEHNLHTSNSLDTFVGLVLFATVVGVVISLVMIALEDGQGRILFRRARCKVGGHRHHALIGGRRVAKLHCQDCKARRKDVNLRIM